MKQFKTCGKQKNLKATREKKRFCTQRMTSDFSLETMQTRRQWNKILKVLKEKNWKPRILYLISSKNEGEICSDIKKKKKKTEVITNRSPTTRNAKWCPSDRRKIMLGGNLDLHKEWTALQMITTWVNM